MNIVIAGDFCPQNKTAKLFEEGDFQTVLGDIKCYLKTRDYSIVNFECPVISGSEIPMIKSGGNLCCASSGVDAIKWAGFNAVTLANNHFRDFGNDGIKNTITTIQKRDIDIVGGGINIADASTILYRNINGKLLAIINCCESEYSIATDSDCGSNPLNPIKQFYEIIEAKKQADYVIVIVHGGHEHYQLPSPRMQETYRFFIDAGADAVINHHQHCYSGYEVYHGKPIFYGLGNFCFDKRNYDPNWYRGYLVELQFNKSVCFCLKPYSQCEEKSEIRFLEGKAFDDFFSNIDKLNSIISSENELRKHFNEYLETRSKSLINVMTPYTGKFLSTLHVKGLIPSLFPKRKYLLLKVMLTCETHRDSFIYYINKQINSL